MWSSDQSTGSDTRSRCCKLVCSPALRSPSGTSRKGFGPHGRPVCTTRCLWTAPESGAECYWIRCIERACSDGARCVRDSVPLGCCRPRHGRTVRCVRDPGRLAEAMRCIERACPGVLSDESALLVLLVIQACLKGRVLQISVLTLSVVWTCLCGRGCSQNRAGLLV